VNYARRQQYRRLSRAGAAGAGAAIALWLALELMSAGVDSSAAVLIFVALGFGVYARHWLSLAARSRVGARSEDEVRRALRTLEDERVAGAALAALAGAWRRRLGRDRTRTSRVRGRDKDANVWQPPPAGGQRTGSLAVPSAKELVPVRRASRALHRLRSRVERWERGVLIVSLDRIVPALR
jgi:hypothetical protein